MSIRYKHIVIVHGIGEEQLNETSINFMNEFCRCLPYSGKLKVINLVTRDTPALVPGKSEPAYVIYSIGGTDYFIGFSEVYWQPVTKGYLAAHHHHTPVPIFVWAHSINIRIEGAGRQSLSGWRETIDNAERLLGMIDTLSKISGKSKLLDKILRDFLGDVQMYAEVDPIHAGVNRVFFDALDDVANARNTIMKRENIDKFDSSETWIVAHSEGTVVSWKSLMLAQTAPSPPAWLADIKGLVTLGSPIDKHRLFWGEQNFPQDIPAPQDKKIRWWNFWDYSDPVGHSLDGLFSPPDAAQNNQFERVCDAGFARYPIPGVAHVDYWTDTNIHHRIIQEVMEIPAGFAPWQLDTGSRWWGKWPLMRFGDCVAYTAGRAIEMAAILYFLAGLLAPFRQGWLLEDLARLSPTGSEWRRVALWIFTPAAAWKLIWDVAFLDWQDKKLNLELQLRIERAAMVLFSLLFVVPALHMPVPVPQSLHDYIVAAAGLFVTSLVWKMHTIVSKGLLQLWRYGKGNTEFKPSPGPSTAAQPD